MKRTLITAQNPVYANAEQTLINVDVKFKEVVYNGAPVFIPFTASPDDTEPHGVDIFNRAVAGEFGEVGAFEE